MLVLGLVLPLALCLWFWLRALNQTPTVSIPTPTMPTPNARDYYIAASNAVLDERKIEVARIPGNAAGRPSDSPTPPSLADKEKLVAENAGAVQLLHQGFQYPYQEPPSRSFNTAFPHYQKIRALARFLSLQAQVEVEKGDAGGATGASLDAIQMGETMPRGGPLIGMLVGAACQAIGRKQAWQAAGHLDAAQARAAARRLEIIRAGHVPFADTMQEEEWCTQAGLLEKMRQRGWPGNIGTFTGDASNILPTQMLLIRCRLSGKRNIMSNYTRYMDQATANARQPYTAHPAAPDVPEGPINQFLLPVFNQARLREVDASTQNALLLVTLALRAYRLDHGAYPPTLAALAPRYLHAVPTDPFALSGPLRYKRTGTSYVLYSVGPDGKDDGGMAIFDRTLHTPTTPEANDRRHEVQENSQGDIVAGVNIS
jgi:type II secretory pathway pseudopilin PulG